MCYSRCVVSSMDTFVDDMFFKSKKSHTFYVIKELNILYLVSNIYKSTVVVVFVTANYLREEYT